MLHESWEVVRVSPQVSLLVDPGPIHLASGLRKFLVYLLLQRLSQSPHPQQVYFTVLVLLVDLPQVLLLELDNFPLDLSVFFCEAVGGVLC